MHGRLIRSHRRGCCFFLADGRATVAHANQLQQKDQFIISRKKVNKHIYITHDQVPCLLVHPSCNNNWFMILVSYLNFESAFGRAPRERRQNCSRASYFFFFFGSVGPPEKTAAPVLPNPPVEALQQKGRLVWFPQELSTEPLLEPSKQTLTSRGDEFSTHFFFNISCLLHLMMRFRKIGGPRGYEHC